MNFRSIFFILILIGSFYLIPYFFPQQTPKTPPSTQVEKKEDRSETTPLPPSFSSSRKEEQNSFSEKLYVLENNYQQLVFSNRGGALSEINLPFRSNENTNSVVKPIGFDRSIEEQSPQNDFFPQAPYYTPSTNGGTQYHEKGKKGGYYPLLRRSIFSSKGGKKNLISPRYYALNLVEEDSSISDLSYEMTAMGENFIEFQASQPHRKITKRFSFPKEAPYCLDLELTIDGDSRNLWISSGIPEVEIVSKAAAPALKYRITRGQKSSVEKIKLPDPKNPITFSSIYPDWVSNGNGFFGIILDPLSQIASGFEAQGVPGNIVPTRLSLIDPQHQLYPATKFPGYELLLPLRSQQIHFRVYAGPYEDDVLKLVDAIYSDPAEGYNPDYAAARSFHGWVAFISEPFAKLLFILMKFFHHITHSWGFSIILLTLALRLMLYPLNTWANRANARMQQVAPQIKDLQEKYKKDPRRMQMEILTLYKEKGANPFMGCFPILIQIPFLMGMFDLLKSAFQLRGASFIPGWIDNLTAPDVLFSWSTPIFFFGTEFHLLPLLQGVVMFVQQRFMSKAPKDKSQWTDQQRQQAVMGNVMSIVFIFLFYNFPSGLNIYFTSSMVLGILQQWYQTKTLPKLPPSNPNKDKKIPFHMAMKHKKKK